MAIRINGNVPVQTRSSESAKEKTAAPGFDAAMRNAVSSKETMIQPAVHDHGELHGRERLADLVRQYGEDNDYAKALIGIEKSIDTFFPGISDEAKDSWIDLSIDSGVNQLTGNSLDGKSGHISQVLVQKTVQDYHVAHGNMQFVDVGWGRSMESIREIIEKAIHDIDHPLSGQPPKSASAQKLVEQERDFYARFLEKMAW
ncbi:MAG: hypothetical protein IJ682_00465 [Lachnospiraceae bacterium]|nr:hypothetical protein [Lachnospiraceae bacterium]